MECAYWDSRSLFKLQVFSGLYYIRLTARSVPVSTIEDCRPMMPLGLGCLVALPLGIGLGVRLVRGGLQQPSGRFTRLHGRSCAIGGALAIASIDITILLV